MMNKWRSFLKYLIPSFLIIELIEYSIFYFAAPDFLADSRYRTYIYLFFFWSGIIGSPIVSMVLYSLFQKKKSTPKELGDR